MLIQFIKDFLNRREAEKIGFPLIVEGHWYSGAWVTWLTQQKNYRSIKDIAGDLANEHHPAEKIIAFNHYRCGLGSKYYSLSTSELIDGLIPATKRDGIIGLYKVVEGPYRRGGSDRLPWDDGKYVDLKLVRTIPEEKASVSS